MWPCYNWYCACLKFIYSNNSCHHDCQNKLSAKIRMSHLQSVVFCIFFHNSKKLLSNIHWLLRNYWNRVLVLRVQCSLVLVYRGNSCLIMDTFINNVFETKHKRKLISVTFTNIILDTETLGGPFPNLNYAPGSVCCWTSPLFLYLGLEKAHTNRNVRPFYLFAFIALYWLVKQFYFLKIT